MTDIHTDAAQIEQAVADYFAAFNETDDVSRTARLRAAFVEESRYSDPLSDAAGRDAIGEMMAGVRQQYPGMEVRRTSAIDRHHDLVRFSWDIVMPDGSALIDGIDVGRVAEDGRLVDIRGFFGVAAPV